MTDKQLLDAFLQFLEDHNYCKRTYCKYCQNWIQSPVDIDNSNNSIRRFCIHWKAITWYSEWCSEAKERIKDESISNG